MIGKIHGAIESYRVNEQNEAYVVPCLCSTMLY
jgi:hypothetical protein